MASNDSPASSGGKGNLRRWASASYGASTGRSYSSLASDQHKRDYPAAGNYCTDASAQIPTAFDQIDKKRTTIKTPVRHRPFTDKHEG